MTEAQRIVQQMIAKDLFSQWMGIEVIYIEPGKCELRMPIKAEMLNGFSIAHGGLAYSLADSALAFASNAHGVKCYSIETSISHVKPVVEGDVLTTLVEEKNLTKRTGLYYITILNQKNEAVAYFKGSVHRSEKIWE